MKTFQILTLSVIIMLTSCATISSIEKIPEGECATIITDTHTKLTDTGWHMQEVIEEKGFHTGIYTKENTSVNVIMSMSSLPTHESWPVQKEGTCTHNGKLYNIAVLKKVSPEEK